MAEFDLYAMCDHCGASHEGRLRVNVPGEFPVRNSIGDTFAGIALPEDLARTLAEPMKCKETGRDFMVTRTNGFLVLSDRGIPKVRADFDAMPHMASLTLTHINPPVRVKAYYDPRSNMGYQVDQDRLRYREAPGDGLVAYREWLALEG